MKKSILFLGMVMLLAIATNAQPPRQQQQQQPSRQQQSQPGTINYPTKANILGMVGGLFLTSNPDATDYYKSTYDLESNYVDYGGGIVYSFRKDKSKNFTTELIFSPMVMSCNTMYKEDDELKMKFIFPLEMRWYLGTYYFKIFIGTGLQYNFIYSYQSEDVDDYSSTTYYDYYGNSYTYNYYNGTTTEVNDEAKAHQMSGNVALGFSINFGQHVHLLLGTKYHFPIINNAEGIEYSKGAKIDFSKDKTSMTATIGPSFSFGKRNGFIMMFNYDLPLGSTKETSILVDDKLNFFQTHSQNLTMSLMWVL